jgi:zinc transport system ATP-binding protein
MLDEPSSGFDPKASSDMYKLIESLSRSGIASVIVSHDIHSALRVGSKILHMRTSPLFYGSASDYANSDAYCEICAHAQEHGIYAAPHNHPLTSDV